MTTDRDFLRALERSVQWRQAILDISINILDNDDGTTREKAAEQSIQSLVALLSHFPDGRAYRDASLFRP